MAWPGSATFRNRFRCATAGAVLLSTILLIVVSDRLHNHSGTEAGLLTLAPAGPRPGIVPNTRPATSGRGVPCLACLHHRTSFVGPGARAAEGRLPSVAIERRRPVPAPPPAPATRPTGLRAPPRG